MICELPGQLPELAALFFFAGFGIYLLFCWVNRVDLNDHDASRNVFIFFVVVVGLFILQGLTGCGFRHMDQVDRDNAFKERKTGRAFLCCCEEAERLKKLKNELIHSNLTYKGNTPNQIPYSYTPPENEASD